MMPISRWEDVCDIYRKYAELIGDGDREIGERIMDSGPSHVVWGDFNFNDSCVKFSIEECDKYPKGYEWMLEYGGCYYADKQIQLIKESLIELLKIPESERYFYDDDDE